MCYGALTKGTQALWRKVLIAAERLGIARLLEQQLQQSQAERYGWVLSEFPILPPKAYRWVLDMLKIAKTLGARGMTPKMFQGAADIYRFVAGTSLGKETPENRDKDAKGRGSRPAIVGWRARQTTIVAHYGLRAIKTANLIGNLAMMKRGSS